MHEADTLIAPDVTFTNLIHISGGPLTSELRVCETGFPVYAGCITQPFHTNAINLGYKRWNASADRHQYVYGPFSNYYLQQYLSSTSRQLGSKLSVGLEYDATHQRFFSGGEDGQVLRRISLSEALGARIQRVDRVALHQWQRRARLAGAQLHGQLPSQI